jgi:hypothetical protein
MSRTTVGILLAVVLVVAAIAYLGVRSGPPPAKLAIVPVDITYDPNTKTCSINNGQPASIKVGDSIQWEESQGYAFSVDFPQGTAFSPGTPFRDRLGNKKYAFSTADPDTNGAQLTLFQKPPHDFPLNTVNVVVNGAPVTCYDSGQNPIPGMKVIVTQ